MSLYWKINQNALKFHFSSLMQSIFEEKFYYVEDTEKQIMTQQMKGKWRCSDTVSRDELEEISKWIETRSMSLVSIRQVFGSWNENYTKVSVMRMKRRSQLKPKMTTGCSLYEVIFRCNWNILLFDANSQHYKVNWIEVFRISHCAVN